MVTKTRVEMKGSFLERDCLKADTQKNIYGEFDNRVFCKGIINKETDSHLEKCISCKAFILNSKPIKNDVRCKDCKFLMFSDFYGECSKGYKGIVNPDDCCGKGVPREQ